MTVGSALPTGGQVSGITSPLSTLGSSYPNPSGFSVYQQRQ